MTETISVNLNDLETLLQGAEVIIAERTPFDDEAETMLRAWEAITNAIIMEEALSD